MLEQYNVSVKLTAQDHISRVLSKLSEKFKLVNSQVSTLERKMAKFKSTLMSGLALGFTGYEGISYLNRMQSAGADYVNTLVQAKELGMSHKEIALATAAAWKTSAQVQSISATEAMKVALGIRYTLGGNMKEALGMLPVVAKFRQIVVGGTEKGLIGSATSPSEMIRSALKAAEMAGRTHSPEQLKSFLGDMTKAVIASSGAVSFQMYHQAIRYSRQAATSLSDEFLTSEMVPLMQEMKVTKGAGGARGGLGSALSAFYRMTVQNIMGHRVRGEFARLGLVNRGQIIGSDLAASDPMKWTYKYLVPALKKAFPKKDNMVLSREASKLFKGNQLAAQLVANMIARRDVLANSIAVGKKVPTWDNLYKISRSSPAVAQMLLSSQWNTLKTAATKDFVVAAVPGLIKFAGALNKLANVFYSHPNLGKDLMVSLYTIFGALTAGGAILIFKAIAAIAVSPIFKVVELLGSVGLAVGLAGVASSLAALYIIVTKWRAMLPLFSKSTWKSAGHGIAYELKHPLTAFKAFPKAMHDFVMGEHVSGVHVRPHTEHKSGMHVYMDGSIVGKIVSKHLADSMSSTVHTQGSKSGYDTSMGLPGVAYGFGV